MVDYWSPGIYAFGKKYVNTIISNGNNAEWIDTLGGTTLEKGVLCRESTLNIQTKRLCRIKDSERYITLDRSE